MHLWDLTAEDQKRLWLDSSFGQGEADQQKLNQHRAMYATLKQIIADDYSQVLNDFERFYGADADDQIETIPAS